MKKLIHATAFALAAGLAVLGASCAGQGKAAPTAASALPLQEADGTVIAEGSVVPVRHVALSSPAAGRVAGVLVAEGDQVQEGQVLVRLGTARLQAAVAAAEAAAKGARARLDELKAGPRPEEVAVAQAALDSARAALQRVREGPDKGQIAAARAQVADAEAALRQAQAAYDAVNRLPGVGARPESLRLEQATNAYDAARGHLDALLGQPRPAEIAVAEAEVRRAQAQLELIAAGARAETIAVLEAEVAAAEAALQEARAALAEAEVDAPFGGTIAALEVKVGEQVAPGAPIVQLADLAAWEIESDDVTEMSVVGVAEGAPVTVTFDALPDLELPGKVAHVRPFGADRQGDIVYRVTVTLDRQDERLHWNMTASVAISPQ